LGCKIIEFNQMYDLENKGGEGYYMKENTGVRMRGMMK
jgi:hypothetical protein